MKCSACGAKTWLSHGAGGAVLCKNCADSGEPIPAVYFQENSEKPDVTLVIPDVNPDEPEQSTVESEETTEEVVEKTIQGTIEETTVQPEDASVKREESAVNPEEIPVKSEEIPVKPEENAVNSYQTQGDYKTSVWITKLVSFIGWMICCIAIFMTFVILIGGIRSGALFPDPGLELLSDRVLDSVKSGLILLGPGLGLFSAGLLLIVVGQAGRALFDNANCSRQMLELMKKKSGL